MKRRYDEGIDHTFTHRNTIYAAHCRLYFEKLTEKLNINVKILCLKSKVVCKSVFNDFQTSQLTIRLQMKDKKDSFVDRRCKTFPLPTSGTVFTCMHTEIQNSVSI